METIYFMLGALSVVLIAAIVSVFRIKSNVMLEVEDLIAETKDDIIDVIDNIETETEKEFTNIEKDLRDTESELSAEIKELNRSVDSRVDKLNTRLEDIIARQIADLYSHVDSKFNDNAAFTDLLHHRVKDLESKS